MDAVVPLQSHCSYATLSASLTLTSKRRVALVFPNGERTCLNDPAVLSAFAKRCQQLGKSVVLIGGDACLRAHAVAAGFEVATTLEDWGDTAPEVRVASSSHDAGARRLWVVTPRLVDTFHTRTTDEHEAWISEPPAYVIELRRSIADSLAASFPEVHAPSMRATATPHPLTLLLDGADEDSTDASERFEEAVIGRILETSDIHRTQIPGSL